MFLVNLLQVETKIEKSKEKNETVWRENETLWRKNQIKSEKRLGKNESKVQEMVRLTFYQPLKLKPRTCIFCQLFLTFQIKVLKHSTTDFGSFELAKNECLVFRWKSKALWRFAGNSGFFGDSLEVFSCVSLKVQNIDFPVFDL